MTAAKRSQRESRSAAEWVTFAVASAVLLTIVGLIAMEATRTKDPAAPHARVIGEPEARGGQHVVMVEVTNAGDRAAENVQVIGELEVGDDTFEAEQLVDFLSGSEATEIALVFPEDPADGTLDVRVAAFTRP